MDNQPKMSKTISIIGAGIGGLTTALSLRQQGLEVDVYESAPKIRPVGAGIIMASNAMQIFRILGIHEEIEQAGNRISGMLITDQRLKTLSSVDLTEYELRYGVHNIAVHRGALQNILAQHVGDANLHLSKRLTDIGGNEDFRLNFEDGSEVHSALVIGADGIGSVVRDRLFEKGRLRNAGQLCWRGRCDFTLSRKYQHQAVEAWGKGSRFGFVRISPQEVYWYALANTGRVNPAEANLTELFSGYHRDIIELIEATDEDRIFFSEIMDLEPLVSWHTGNACLMGDAAHATTPNLGQGACQAVEDAYVLGQLLGTGVPASKAFREYENLRRRKAQEIVDTSWKLGKIAQLENPLAIQLRNVVLLNLPERLSWRQLDRIFSLDYFKEL